MKGSDLRCPTCGGPAVDVSLDTNIDAFFFPETGMMRDYQLLPPSGDSFLAFRCPAGHTSCIHMNKTAKGITYDYLPDPRVKG